MAHLSGMLGDTIVAISTPLGRSGIGVIRMSGPDALVILAKIFTPLKGASDFPDRTTVYGTLVDSDRKKAIDDGIAVAMRGPASYTGEDVVELSLHGSPTVLDTTMRLICRRGARPATKGEFTRRAFLSGKLDLVQAEAVIDLIDSVTPAAAEDARARLDRSLSRKIESLSAAIKDVIAEIEAHIDFDEEGEYAPPQPEPALRGILRQMEALQQTAEAGRIRREGIAAVIVGKPNVGKSTLFNALLGIDRVIVTPYPGTTRDPVDAQLELGGIRFVLWDTAGIRPDPEPVEEEGILRTHSRIHESDLVLAVLDGSSLPDADDSAVLAACSGKKTVIVLNKADLGMAVNTEDAILIARAAPSGSHQPVAARIGSEAIPDPVEEQEIAGDQLAASTNIPLPYGPGFPARHSQAGWKACPTEGIGEGECRVETKDSDPKPNCIVAVSAKTGDGVQRLADMISAVGAEAAEIGTPLPHGSLTKRGLILVEAAATPIRELLRYRTDTGHMPGPDIVSLELRRSLAPLAELTGAGADEGILERIFERFCVGK